MASQSSRSMLHIELYVWLSIGLCERLGRLLRTGLAILTPALLFPTAAMADGLFDTDAPLSIAIASNFKAMDKARDKTMTYPGTLTIDAVSLPIELSLRGNFRLRTSTCRHPPLRVDFKKSEQKDTTVFAGEGDLKLVVQCRYGKSYDEYLRAEFLVYKLLNKVTPLSYRVRWVDVAYSETDNKKANVRHGFFVERKKSMARRNNLQPASEIHRTSHDTLDGSQAALLEHFQFLIGNTDFSLVRSADPEECCHNAKLLQQNDGGAEVPAKYQPVIYDFDSTGLVDAVYAEVPDSIGITRVTQRLYRGVCRDQDVMLAARDNLLQHQADLLDLINTDNLLSSRKKNSTIKFLNQGFDIFLSAERYEQLILKSCL